jgi:S-DNA-T family DNA segregation ATPase FtsK/SpoIIIE
LSNQGKTAAIRALLLWLAHDPTVEFWLADLKGIGDWGMFAGLAAVLIQGPADEHVIAATEMLEAGVTEMERRLSAVQALGTADGVTRHMARAGTGLHPLVLLVDEAQIAFMSPAVGEDRRPYGGTKVASRFYQTARKILNQGRAVNVTLWLGTQDPTNENLPKIVREAAHIRASLVLGTEAQARMAVGGPAVDGGAAPHKLRQGLDKGTLVVSGDGLDLPPGAMSVTVRTYYIDGAEATELADRARARRTPVDTADGVAAGEPRDELADLETALRGEPRVGTTAILGRLAEIDRRYYEPWTAGDLTELCERPGFKPRKVSTMWIYADDVRAAITWRDEGEEIDE